MALAGIGFFESLNGKGQVGFLAEIVITLSKARQVIVLFWEFVKFGNVSVFFAYSTSSMKTEILKSLLWR